ncbi:hypothetical protein L218DRAFT_1081490 [Marasmius fiardii PR-910]|nr:hypothetical protein L218DRAFT_1081490 [Marasmius fiardii PR-910]
MPSLRCCAIKSPSSTFIPIEMVDNILGFCDDPTIESCSVVCKSLTPICQPRLFERLSIRQHFSGISLEGRRGIHNVDSNSRLLLFTQEIHFFLQVPNFSIQNTSDLLRPLINDLKGKVKRLKRIEIYSDQVDGLLKNDTATLISSSFSRINQLKIRSRGENLGLLLRFACSFRNLKVLELECESPRVELRLVVPTLKTAPYMSSTECGFQTIVPTLATVTSHLRKIVLILGKHCLDHKKLEETSNAWVRLDDILATPRFSRTILDIKIVTGIYGLFGSKEGGSNEARKEGVKRLLKTCSAQGRLVFYDIPNNPSLP